MQNNQKQMKNDQSLQYWQFQSLKFQNLSKIVLMHLFWKKSQPKSFKNQELSKMDFGWKVWRICKFGPWEFWKMKKNNNNKVWSLEWESLATLVLGDTLGKIHFSPPTYWKLQKWSLCLLQYQPDPLFYLNPKQTQP